MRWPMKQVGSWKAHTQPRTVKHHSNVATGGGWPRGRRAQGAMARGAEEGVAVDTQCTYSPVEAARG